MERMFINWIWPLSSGTIEETSYPFIGMLLFSRLSACGMWDTEAVISSEWKRTPSRLDVIALPPRCNVILQCNVDKIMVCGEIENVINVPVTLSY